MSLNDANVLFLYTVFLSPFLNLCLAFCTGDQKLIESDEANNLTQVYVLCSKDEMWFSGSFTDPVFNKRTVSSQSSSKAYREQVTLQMTPPASAMVKPYFSISDFDLGNCFGLKMFAIV